MEYRYSFILKISYFLMKINRSSTHYINIKKQFYDFDLIGDDKSDLVFVLISISLI